MPSLCSLCKSSNQVFANISGWHPTVILGAKAFPAHQVLRGAAHNALIQQGLNPPLHIMLQDRSRTLCIALLRTWCIIGVPVELVLASSIAERTSNQQTADSGRPARFPPLVVVRAGACSYLTSLSLVRNLALCL